MRGRTGEPRGVFCWLLVWLVALWPAACMRHRTAGPEAIARSQSGKHRAPPANATGVALKPTGAEGPRNTNAPAPGATVVAPGKAPSVSEAVAPLPVAAQGPLRISITHAIVMALENNPELAVERLNPQILDTYAEEEQAVFDPLLAAMLGHERVRAEDLSSSGTWFDYPTDSVVGEATLAKLFPTGTRLELGALTEVDDASSDGKQLVAARLGMTVSQALLRGAGTQVNLARVREARLDVLASEYEVRGFTEALVALVEQTYWDYVLARRQIEIYEGSIALALQLLQDVQQRAAAGALAASDMAAAEAEVALRRQELVDARSDMARAKALLLGFLNVRRAVAEQRGVEFVGNLV